jgi:hypothetical protein
MMTFPSEQIGSALSVSGTSLPSLFMARPAARTRLRDFFSSHLRNPNTRRAYREAVRQFSAFCAKHDIADLAQVEPIHVAAFVEAQLERHSRPTVKQRLAALRMLFDRGPGSAFAGSIARYSDMPTPSATLSLH